MKITLKAVVTWIAAALAIAAFIVAFGVGIKGELIYIPTEFKGLAFGKQTTITEVMGKVVESETKDPIPSLISRIAVLLILFGGIISALIGTFRTKFSKKGLLLFVAVVTLVGAIMILFTKEGWIDAQIKDMFKDSSASQSTIDKAKDNMTKTYEEFVNNGSTIATSVLGLASAFFTALAATMGKKKSRK